MHGCMLRDGGPCVGSICAAMQASANAGRQVTFFMRKGADVLSKWCVRTCVCIPYQVPYMSQVQRPQVPDEIMCSAQHV